MTTDEFIIQFDIFYNNIASNAAPSINNFEKSVFLTQAQRDIIIELYNGKNPLGLSFESTEESRLYLRELVSSKEYTSNFNSIIVSDDMWFITREEVSYSSDIPCIYNSTPTVVPIRQDKLRYALDNPYLGPSRNRVLRVEENSYIKLYSKYNISKYKIHYIKRPKPIILENLEDVTIEGHSDISECELNPILHRAILERAVLLAKQAYIGKSDN